MISFRIDYFDLLAMQGTVYSLFLHHNSKVSILQHSAIIVIQLSHLNVTTGKTIALTIWTLVGKVISLLFNMLSSFVITLLPRNMEGQFNFMAAVTVHSDFGYQENKVSLFALFPYLFVTK